MQIRGRRYSEFLADELTVAVMAKAIRNIDFSDCAARNLAYRDAEISLETSCELDGDAVRIARIYRDHVARPRAASGIVSCVLAAALFSPAVAHADPVLTAAGTAAVASASGWLWWALTHAAAAVVGALVMGLFNAGANSDSAAVRQADDDAQMSPEWRRANPREVGK